MGGRPYGRLSQQQLGFLLPRDATQSAVLLQQVVCPSVCLSVRDVDRGRDDGDDRLEIFKNNFTVKLGDGPCFPSRFYLKANTLKF